MKTLKIHIQCKLMQSGQECPRVHYWRHTWINYRPSALQRFYDMVPSWSEADALCGLPREQSALFIRAARVGKWRGGWQEGWDSKTLLTLCWTQSESDPSILCIRSLLWMCPIFLPFLFLLLQFFPHVGFRYPRILSSQVILCSSMLTQQHQQP